MRVVPVYFTGRTAAMRGFLEALGLRSDWVADNGEWVSMHGSGGGVGVHDAASADTPQASGTTTLSFESEEPLEQVADRLTAAGFEATIVDESWGRSLRTTDPDGREQQINEAMSDSYGYSRPDE